MASSRTIAARLCSRLGSLSLNHVAKPSSSPGICLPWLPVELSTTTLLMPLHTAIASSLLLSSSRSNERESLCETPSSLWTMLFNMNQAVAIAFFFLWDTLHRHKCLQ
ncbi:hypothetical protein MLD38_006862 [Melastoma candidum]|uniref:Uncharacterized protein n=1 Tax=Melastoma candidum TaxID=119954 RepID=A0ACB9RNS8_9MYRT|nr:hypothetical protein MLD38_006862 [Melastoma candidum]